MGGIGGRAVASIVGKGLTILSSSGQISLAQEAIRVGHMGMALESLVVYRSVVSTGTQSYGAGNEGESGSAGGHANFGFGVK